MAIQKRRDNNSGLFLLSSRRRRRRKRRRRKGGNKRSNSQYAFVQRHIPQNQLEKEMKIFFPILFGAASFLLFFYYPGSTTTFSVVGNIFSRLGHMYVFLQNNFSPILVYLFFSFFLYLFSITQSAPSSNIILLISTNRGKIDLRQQLPRQRQ